MEQLGAGTGRDRARRIIIDLAIMTVIGLVLALIGPFGSFAEPLPSRIIVWLGFAYAGYAIYSPMGWFVERLHLSLDLPRAALWLAAVIIATIPMTILVSVVGTWTGGLQLPSMDRFFDQYPYVFIIGGGVTLLFNQLQATQPGQSARSVEPAPTQSRQQESETLTPKVSPAAPSEGAPSVTLPRLVDRLPPELGTTILALENEDHYVRVHTTLGSDLVLMRMRDAVAELDGIEGMQVHRSWWVSRDAVDDVRREGRNVRLVLPGELQAPVSRANVEPLRQAGWI